MAWSFDEINDYVTLDDDPALTLPDGDWSLGGWIKLRDNVGDQSRCILSMNAWGANPSFNWVAFEAGHSSAGKIEATIGDNDTTDVTVVSAVGPSNSTDWQHVLLVRSGNTITQYIDGEVNGSDTDAAFDAIDGAMMWKFGGTAGGGPSYFFGGEMAQWAKYDRALTPDEIAGLAAGYSPARFDPAWHVPMDSGVYEELIVPLTVTNYGSTGAEGPPIDEGDPVTSTIVPGVRCWEYDGNDEVVATRNASLDLPDGDWTVGGWIKIADNSGTALQVPLDRNYWGSPSFGLYFYEDAHATTDRRGNLGVHLEDAAGHQISWVTDGGHFFGGCAWTHILLEKTSTTFRILIDGVEPAYTAHGGDPADVNAIDPAADMYFGSDQGGGTFMNAGARMAHWFKVNRVLTVQEISDLSHATSPLPPDEALNDLVRAIAASTAWYHAMNDLEDWPNLDLTNNDTGLVNDYPPGIAVPGDYSTLGTWETARDDDFRDEIAECYGGGNLGFVNLTGGWTARIVTIRAATDESPYIASHVGNRGILQPENFTLTVEGLEIRADGYLVQVASVVGATCTLRKCRPVGLGGCLIAWWNVAMSGTYNLLVENCLNRGLRQCCIVALDVLVTGTPEIHVDVYHNTVDHGDAGSRDGMYFKRGVDKLYVLTAYNNISVRAPSGRLCYDVADSGGGAGMTIVASNNLDDDGSADSRLGGADNVTEVDLALIFTDYANGDYTLVEDTSVAQDVGVNLAGTVDDDIVGLNRPQGGIYDLGCYETYILTVSAFVPMYGMEHQGFGLGL